VAFVTCSLEGKPTNLGSGWRLKASWGRLRPRGQEG